MDNLPSYTTDYQPKKQQQTREQRLNKFNNGIYKNKGQQAEKVYNTEDTKSYKFVKKDNMLNWKIHSHDILYQYDLSQMSTNHALYSGCISNSHQHI